MDSSLYSIIENVEQRHWWYVGRNEIFKAALRSAVHTPSGDVLDVGCGMGTLLPVLRPYGRVVGVDNNQEAVRYSKTRGYATVIEADARSLPFDSMSFDLVAAADIIEHIEIPDQLLTELVRVLRPGGTLFITTAAFLSLWSRFDELSHQFRRYTRENLLTQMRQYPLSLALIRYNVVFFVPIAVFRMVEKLFPNFFLRPISPSNYPYLHTLSTRPYVNFWLWKGVH